MSAAPNLKVVAVPKADDAVRERHGCACRDGSDNSASWLTVWEGEGSVYIDGNMHKRQLTPWQARYLASKLYRLSRRIRQRTGDTA